MKFVKVMSRFNVYLVSSQRQQNQHLLENELTCKLQIVLDLLLFPSYVVNKSAHFTFLDQIT